MTIRATLLRSVLDLDGPETPTEDTWTVWRATAERERVVPQLHEIAAGNLATLGEDRVDEAQALHVHVAALSVRLEQALLEVVALLDAADIPSAVLKGIATGHLDHTDPSRRQFGDIDLLIDGTDLRRAVDVLGARGWRQTVPLPRYHERFEHALTMGGGGIAELDLHHRLAPRAIGRRVPTRELLAQREQLRIAGRTLWALSRCDRLIHAGVHAIASQGQFRKLSSLADVLVLCRAANVEPAAVLRRAERWRLRPLVEGAIHLAHAEAQLDLPAAWTEAMAAPMRGRDRLVERAYLGDGRRLGWEELAHLRSLPGWGARTRYVFGHLRPQGAPGSEGIVPRLRYLRSRLGDPMRPEG